MRSKKIVAKRVCIVTNAPISQNPRVVKEADALKAAGYDVVVLFAQHAEWTCAMDQRILDRAAWRGEAVRAWPRSVIYRASNLVASARMKVFRQLSRFIMSPPIVEFAYCRYLFCQLWSAVRVRADLYIGHNPQSLPIVAWAARITGAKYGFDFEDYHQGEAPSKDRGLTASRLLAALESRYLPKACHITTSSWGISAKVAATYGVARPSTVLNVFNWSDRSRLPSERERVEAGPLSLYWFSQIVSLDRGLEDAIQALQYVTLPVVLHIRGNAPAKTKSNLLALARICGVESQIFFHDPVAPEDLLASAIVHDVGLCLEVPFTINRDICVTNKMFLYMLAGLAIIASRTSGHAEVLTRSPDIGFLYENNDARSLAIVIERLARDKELLATTKARALDAARRQWNWERESNVLIASVADTI